MIKERQVFQSLLIEYLGKPTIKVTIDGTHVLTTSGKMLPNHTVRQTRRISLPRGAHGYVAQFSSNDTDITRYQFEATPESKFRENILFHYYEIMFNKSLQIRLYMDEVRISKGVDRTSDSTDPMYIVSGSTFTPPTQAYDALSVNATGNFTSTNQTASASVSKMGIVVLYKDLYGTATLNTDITAELSANGGSNYATATLLDRGTFSTGIKMVVANDVAVTAGTSCKYRISFANQADDSKETQVHGVALLY